jgi:outer membrane protein TolC
MSNRLIYALMVAMMAILNVKGQTVTLDECVGLARRNYPQWKQLELIEQSRRYSVENVKSALMPRVLVGGQASYQSDVTGLPISLPGVDIPGLEKDQYRIYGDVSQSITDMLTITRYRRELVEVNSDAERAKIEADLYLVGDRVQQIYFGILLIDTQLKQLETVKSDIDAGMERVKVAVVNGAALESSLDILKAELLGCQQNQITLESAKRAYLAILSQYTGIAMGMETVLQKPAEPQSGVEIRRLELNVFDSKIDASEIEKKMSLYSLKPNISLFAQGGYGRPGLNMLNNSFDWFYMGGIRLSWNISGFYTHKRNVMLSSVNQNRLVAEKEKFLFDINQSVIQQREEISKIDSLIVNDHQIIELRSKVKQSALGRLEFGTETPSDYLSFVNSENRARQDLEIHRLSRIMAVYKLKTLTGN